MIMCSSWDASASRYQRCSRCSTTSLGSAIRCSRGSRETSAGSRTVNVYMITCRSRHAWASAGGSVRAAAASASRDQRAEHVLHDPAVAEIVRLAGRVDPDDRPELPAVRADRDLRWHRPGVDLLDAGHVEHLAAGEAE